MKNIQLFIVIISSCLITIVCSECTSTLCLNGGTCYTGTSSYVCSCPDKYWGPRCEFFESSTNTTPCAASTCANGGVCYNGQGASFFCECPLQYEGTHCEIISAVDTTACRNQRCLNGGSCYEAQESDASYCSCLDGYSGTLCEIEPFSVDFCASNPCTNDGSCYSGRSTFICICLRGFTGDLCHLTTPDHCDSVVCANGGRCFSSPTRYYCECVIGFTGDHCQTEVPRLTCLDGSCFNDALCYLSASGELTNYYCECQDGFTGRRCEVLVNDICSYDKPCLNDGSCDTKESEYGSSVPVCTCPITHIGSHCQTRVSCLDVPCVNDGTCTPSGGNQADMRCACPEDFYGVLCEHQVDICVLQQPCLNGGTCFTSSQNLMSFFCQCPETFEGDSCQRTNHCAEKPCMNGGACVMPLDPNVDLFSCQCSRGFVGILCETADAGGACGNETCMNGGECVPSPFASGGLTCNCPSTHIGDRCEQQQLPFACVSSPCQNGATCEDTGDGNYQCDCLQGYAGLRCEVVGPCVSSPCSNEGTCVQDVHIPGNFLCICSDRYTGTTCTIPPQEDPCNSSPCQNSAECIPTNAGTTYQCNCTGNFVGVNCDVIDPCTSQPCSNGGRCNGILTNSGNWDFFCTCTAEFVGITCSVPRACTSNPCLNGGECNNGPEWVSQPVYGVDPSSQMLSYNCRCTAMWTGTNCETEVVDSCMSQPCQNNGICFRSHTTERFFCMCPSGFYGTYCVADPCADIPCRNGGTCRSSGSGYECLCSAGYLGKRCSLEDPCSQMPCLNGAVCINVDSNIVNSMEYQCLCRSGYGGLTCAVNFGDPLIPSTTRASSTIMTSSCSPDPCQNDGMCFEGSMSQGYVCVCSAEYTGVHCETKKDVIGQTAAVSDMTTTASGCVFGAQTYVDGDTWEDGCKDCVCNGTMWTCKSERCDCLVEGRLYNNGESWKKGCEICSCLGGRSSCSAAECVNQCMQGGVTYSSGTNRSDGCNTCTCDTAVWTCTERSCGSITTCSFLSVVYLERESRQDDCNTCSCFDGQWLCTKRDCTADPIRIKVEFSFIGDFSNVASKEEMFIRVLRADLQGKLGLQEYHLQDISIVAGSIKVTLYLVQNKTDNVNITAAATALETEITKNSYTLVFEGRQYPSDPGSFVATIQTTVTVARDNLVILIVTVACGAVGVMIVIGSVCWLVHKHKTTRQLTTYGDERIPRASDRTSWDGIENDGYDSNTRIKTTSRI